MCLLWLAFQHCKCRVLASCVQPGWAIPCPNSSSELHACCDDAVKGLSYCGGKPCPYTYRFCWKARRLAIPASEGSIHQLSCLRLSSLLGVWSVDSDNATDSWTWPRAASHDLPSIRTSRCHCYRPYLTARPLGRILALSASLSSLTCSLSSCSAWSARLCHFSTTLWVSGVDAYEDFSSSVSRRETCSVWSCAWETSL